MCAIPLIFVLLIFGVAMIGPWFVKEWQSPENEFKAIIFIVIYYVGAITASRFIIKIIEDATGCYFLEF